MLIEGKRFALFFLFLVIVVIYYLMKTSKKIERLRTFPALAGIEEAVGRSAEMGRPVHASPGSGYLMSSYGAETLCGLAAVNYAAKCAAEKGADFICTISREDNLKSAEEAVRTAYLEKGLLDQYNPDMVRFSPYGPAYDAMLMGIAERDRPGANIIIGPWHHPSLYVIEVMGRVGAMSVGGTTRITMAPFFVGCCDYYLIGEEVMAVGALLSENEIVLSSIKGQDYLKYLAMIIIFLGTILTTFGNDIIKQVMSW